MKKTPMQELIQSLKAEQMTASNEWQTGYQKALSNVIDEAESMLEKEMAEIIESFHTGMEMQRLDPNNGIAEEYYNLRFNTKEK
jgi:hypothetical protein